MLTGLYPTDLRLPNQCKSLSHLTTQSTANQIDWVRIICHGHVTQRTTNTPKQHTTNGSCCSDNFRTSGYIPSHTTFCHINESKPIKKFTIDGTKRTAGSQADYTNLLKEYKVDHFVDEEGYGTSGINEERGKVQFGTSKLNSGLGAARW